MLNLRKVALSGAFMAIALSCFHAKAQNGIETLVQPIRSMFADADVVFLGESHVVANQKDVFRTIMSGLVESNTVDTVAVEFIQYAGNDLLQEYLRDPDAGQGTEKETEYFLRFSNCNRRCGPYLRADVWPIMDLPYQSVLREMRRLVQARPAIHFCGVNAEDDYKQQFTDINSDLVGLNLLAEDTKNLGARIFGDRVLGSGESFGWGSGPMRELRFASNVRSCLSGSKKALVFTGGYHAMQASKYVSLIPEAAHAAMVADLLGKLTNKKVRSGAIATASESDMKEPNRGLWGRKFQENHSSANYQLIEARSFSSDLIADSTGYGYAQALGYDFLITGPLSADINSRYDLPNKSISTAVRAGELSNVGFKRQQVQLRPHLARWIVNGRTTLEFELKMDGRFLFQFQGEVKSVRLDGEEIPTSQLLKVLPTSPLQSPLYIINRTLSAGTSHSAEVHFTVSSGAYTIGEGYGGKFLTIETRTYNPYGIGVQWLFPTINLPTTNPQLTLSIVNSEDFKVSDSHVLCNCDVTKKPGVVRLAFNNVPSQQIYFSLRPKALADEELNFQIRPGLQVQARLSHFFYGVEFLRQKRNADQARASLEADLINPLKQVITETILRMESMMGPYPHGSKLVVNIHPDYSGSSMEYAGAVHSGLGILVHELLHQWFATAVRPQTNADSWLMESITTWLEQRKFGDLRTKFEPFMQARKGIQPSTPLAVAETSYRYTNTPYDAKFCPSPAQLDLCEGFSLDWYNAGPWIFDAIEGELVQRSGGTQHLDQILRELYSRYKGQHIRYVHLVSLLKAKQPDGPWDEIFSFAK